jgi:hypothetical protein
MGLFTVSLGDGDGLQQRVLCLVSKLIGNLTSATLDTSDSDADISVSLSRLICSFVGLLISWFLGSCIWHRYLSPISDIPGPFFASFSRLWLIQLLRRGKAPKELADLHEKYGE